MRVTATGPLQTIVDSLAADIRRDVAIDDRQIRWIVHSPHFDEPDAARLQSILERRVSDDAAQWAFSFGIEQAEGPVRLPANERIGAQPRLCIPLRSHGVLLGFLFIVDPDESLSEKEVEQAQAAAGAAAEVLYRERRLRELERGRERWLLMHLLDDEAEGDEAAQALVDEGFVDARRVALLVARAEPGAQEREQVELAIGAALDRLRRDVPARRGVALRRPDHGVFLVAIDDSATTSPRALAERLLALADDEGLASGARVGVGAPHDLAAARESYREARDALAIAERVERFGRIAIWDELGAYRTLSRFPLDARGRGAASGARRDAERPGARAARRHAGGVSRSRGRRQGDGRGAHPAPRDAVLPPEPHRGDHRGAVEDGRRPPRAAPRAAAGAALGPALTRAV